MVGYQVWWCGMQVMAGTKQPQERNQDSHEKLTNSSGQGREVFPESAIWPTQWISRNVSVSLMNKPKIKSDLELLS